MRIAAFEGWIEAGTVQLRVEISVEAGAGDQTMSQRGLADNVGNTTAWVQ